MASRYSDIETNIPHLRRFALALTRDRDRADDLVQDTIERAISRWILRKPGLPLRPWLFTILRNLHISWHRKNNRFVQVADGQLENIGAIDASAEARMELSRVLQLLSALPEDQRVAILLVSVEGFSYAQAATIMKIPVGTLMSRLSRGRRRLRDLVESPTDKTLRRVV